MYVCSVLKMTVKLMTMIPFGARTIPQIYIQEHTDTALLMLSLYQQITLTHASAQPEKQITPEVLKLIICMSP